MSNELGDLRSTGSSAPRVLRLVVSGVCGQSCEFCSIPSHYGVGRDGEEARLQEEMRRAADEGASALLLTGLDPLAFPAIVSLMAKATAAGFLHVDVHSPAVRLADATFRRSLLSALPKGRRFYAPLYGACPAVHDRAVGVRGAFDRVIAALAALAAEGEQATIVTVLTTATLPHLASIAAVARERGLSFFAQLPFPESEAPSDRYFQVAPRMTEVADTLLSESDTRLRSHAFRIPGLAPCVLVHRARALGHHAHAALRARFEGVDRPPPLPRNDRTPHVSCPHAADCAISPPCSGTVLRAYVTLHGDGELSPVQPLDVAG